MVRNGAATSFDLVEGEIFNFKAETVVDLS